MNISRYESSPDAELEGLAAEGSKEAFAALYNRHFDRVYDFSLRLVRDADEAADVAQETFLKAMAALSPKKKTAAFTTWVLTIARNTALNRLRSRRKVAEPSLEETEQPEAIYREVDSSRLGSPEEAAEAKELAGLVWQAATALDAKQYSLLDLHLRQGLDSGEIADVLGTSKNNAYVMMSRLRDSVEESITAFIMARRGRRECDALNDLLTGRGTVFFDADMRKVVARHIEACPACREQRKKLVSPSAIFGALAVVPVPLGLKQKALAEAMGQWATLAGSEAGKAGSVLSRLLQPLRSALNGLKQAGWFAGWKGATLLVGALVVAGIGGAAVVFSVVLGGGDGVAGGPVAGAPPATPTASGSPTPPGPTPSPTPAPIPTEVLDTEVFLGLRDNTVPGASCYLAAVRPATAEVVALTESYPPGTFSGGTVTSSPLPPRFLALGPAEASNDGAYFLLRGAGGSDDFAFHPWTLLDRSTGMVSGLYPEDADPYPVSWAVEAVPGGPRVGTSLVFATWHPAGDGSIVGVFSTGQSDFVEIGGTTYSYGHTLDFTIGVRSPAGEWEGPVLTVTAEQLGFVAPPPPTNRESLVKGTLQVPQFVALEGSRFLIRVSPASSMREDFGKGGAVFIVGPSSANVLRVFDTDERFGINRAAGLIISSDGRAYSLEDGSPVAGQGVADFGPTIAWSPDGTYRLSVAAGADGAGPLRIEVSSPSTNALETVEVALDPNVRLCSEFQVGWAGT